MSLITVSLFLHLSSYLLNHYKAEIMSFPVIYNVLVLSKFRIPQLATMYKVFLLDWFIVKEGYSVICCILITSPAGFRWAKGFYDWNGYFRGPLSHKIGVTFLAPPEPPFSPRKTRRPPGAGVKILTFLFVDGFSCMIAHFVRIWMGKAYLWQKIN